MRDEIDRLLFEPAYVVGERMASGEITSLDVVEAALSRIIDRNPLLNAFLTVTPEEARSGARAADHRRRSGKSRGPLDGIPIVVKDLLATRGVRTTGGSRVMERWVPDRDACVVEKLREKGTIMVGKTAMPEFAASPCSANPHFGPVRNPWNPRYDTLASSSGTAAAIADGMAYLGPGSDTGGSIRLPAAACGLIGLKPTYGRVSLRGVIPLCPGQDHIGPMARNVTDASMLLDVLAGFDPADLSSVDVAYESAASGLRNGLDGLRVAYLDDGQGPIDAEIAEGVADGVRMLAHAGAEVDEIRIPLLGDVLSVGTSIWESEVAFAHRHWLPDRAGELDPNFLAFVERGLRHSAVDLLSARSQMRRILREVDQGLRQFSLVAGPVLHVLPPLAGQRRNDLVRFTVPWNFNGWPALTIPVRRGSEGIPIGLQIIGKPWGESVVLRAAYAIEQQFSLAFPPQS